MVCPRSHWACHSDAAGDSWRFGVLSGCCFSEPRCHAPKITQGSPKRELPGRIEYEHEHRPPGRAEHEHDETQSSAAFLVLVLVLVLEFPADHAATPRRGFGGETGDCPGITGRSPPETRALRICRGYGFHAGHRRGSWRSLLDLVLWFRRRKQRRLCPSGRSEIPVFPESAELI